MAFLENLVSPSRIRSPTNGMPKGVITASPVVGFPSGNAENLSAVFACIEMRSNDVASLPNYIINRHTKERIAGHPVLSLLNERPNVRMTPFARRKLLQRSLDVNGNAYDWIVRDPVSRQAVELIPLIGEWVTRYLDREGNLLYQIRNPLNGEVEWAVQEDICDYKGPTNDGLNGLSVLEFARSTIESGLAAQEYNKNFYLNNGQPGGILTVDAPLTGYAEDGSGKTVRELVRDEWEKLHKGPSNAMRTAILEAGFKYQSLSISQADAQFVEQQGQTVKDIARYFSIPLYKLQEGKQSYSSNEQNSIEYTGSLRPGVIQREQEQTYKLLNPSDRANGLEISTNMMALLRSDSGARANYYRTMREMGGYNINEIRAYEELPPVAGGDEYAASLNYVPLQHWAELSMKRAGGNNNESEA